MTPRLLPFEFDDGGREEAGRRGRTGDCVVRALAIATRTPYSILYDEMYDAQKVRVVARRAAGKKARDPSPRNGVNPAIYKPWLAEAGWLWTPTMQIGSGTTHHLRWGEVPMTGPVIVRLSGHLCAVVDGVIRDTYDCSREGTRAVYGWWTPTQGEAQP